MSGSDFEVKGLDDLSEKLLSAIEEFPGTTEKGLVTLGNKLKKECVKNTPEGSTGKLKKGWKHKVEGYNGSELVYELINKHPVHHLLNNGHAKKTPGGRPWAIMKASTIRRNPSRSSKPATCSRDWRDSRRSSSRKQAAHDP